MTTYKLLLFDVLLPGSYTQGDVVKILAIAMKLGAQVHGRGGELGGGAWLEHPKAPR